MTYGATWNKKWLDVCNGDESTDDNAKTAAHLCDSSKWTRYVSAPATYAVGGPTLELLVASIKAKGVTDSDYSSEVNSVTNKGYEKPYDGAAIAVPKEEPYIAKCNSTHYGNSWLASPCDAHYGLGVALLGYRFCFRQLL